MQSSNSSYSAIHPRRHFHTFDALRFFAFLKVFLLHLPVAAYPWFNFIKEGGGIGVQFFFVLSGFLITYIICDEKERTGKLNLKNFFVRRVLRIWPLYYLMVIVAYATPYIQEQLLSLPYSSDGYEPEWWYSVFFIENYKMMIMQDHANVSPLSIMWTLCIEEHYYLAWGILLYFTDTKFLPRIIAICLLTGIISRAVYWYAGLPTIDILTNIDLFAYGAIPAYLLVKKEALLKSFSGKISPGKKKAYAAIVIVAVMLCSQVTSDLPNIILVALLGGMFALLITFILAEQNALVISDKNLLSKLGVYTYGLYLYHILVLVILRQVFVKAGLAVDEPINAVLFVLAALVCTIFCSYASYHLFEKQFLKLKRFFR